MTTRTDTPTDIIRATGLAAAVELAADGDNRPAGYVKALVSAYGVKYRIGYARWHTIEPGAFAKSLAEQDAIPLFWMHAWDWSEQMPTGAAVGTEVEAGLELEGRHYVDLDPSIARLHESIKDGAIVEWSIGYRILASRRDPDDEMHEFVTEAELLEASSVLRGANPATGTLDAAGVPDFKPGAPVPAPGAVVVPAGYVLVPADQAAQLTSPPADTPPADPPVDAAGELTDDEQSERLALLARAGVREAFGAASRGTATDTQQSEEG